MNKEERRAYMRAWYKANPDKVKEYAKRAQERVLDTHNHHQPKGRVIRKSTDKDKKLFIKTSYLSEDKMTAYEFMRTDAIKLAKLDYSKLRIMV